MLKYWRTNGTSKPFYARKKIMLNKPFSGAEAIVCGLGQFNFYINGKKVSDHVLDPAWTDYRKTVQYVRFDVTDYLQNGENVIGIEVGNGWFIKEDFHYTFTFPIFMPPNPNDYKAFSDRLMFALRIKILFTDGTEEIIESDRGFMVCEHPITLSNIYGSEHIDGMKNQPGWNDIKFSEEMADTNWTEAAEVSEKSLPEGIHHLVEQEMPPIRVIETYAAAFVHSLEKEHYLADVPQQVEGGTMCRPSYDPDLVADNISKQGKSIRRDIYDFGQNMSFMLHAEVRGKKGDVVYFHPAEKLTADGDVDQVAKGWCTVNTCVEYRIGQDDAWEEVSSVFAYLAGRYVGVEYRSRENNDGFAEIRNMRAEAITSAWKAAGTFTCDDKRFEQIYHLVEKAVEANMVSVHTDCPTIERFAWQEPNHLMAPAIMYMKDGRKLWDKFLQDMRDSQHTNDDYFMNFDGSSFPAGDGLVPSQAPCYVPNAIAIPGMGSFYDIIPWGSSSIIGAYWHYQFYGDKKIIEDNYEMGKRYLCYLMSKMTAEGFINHGLGDWGNPEKILVRENIETAFLYADTIIMQSFAEILGYEADAVNYREEAEIIKKNYNEKLLTFNVRKNFWCYKAWSLPKGAGEGTVYMTQAAEALPLYWGMVPKEYVDDVAKALRYTLEEKNSFVCGEVGLPYVIQCARKYGMNDLISTYILREQHPSYYAFVLDGETTLGEYWETNPRSHCHDMMGHIVEWFYNGIAGIIADKPGFREVTIRPYLPESMKEFTCRFDSASGMIRVHVKESENEILVETECAHGIVKHIDTGNLVTKTKKINIW